MNLTDKIVSNKWLSYGLIALVSFLLYFRCVHYGFALDDTIVYDENKFVEKGLAGIWDILSKESFTGYFGVQQDYVAGARYRPLSIVTFAIEKQIFGKSTVVAHLVNILLYILCGIVVYNFLRKISNRFGWSSFILLIGALLFIIHPIHTEAVANIKGRDEILCLLFSMLTLNIILDHQEKPSVLKILSSSIFYFLALMSKENAITFLAVIPLTLVFFRNEPGISAIIKTWFIWIPAILFLIIRTKVIGYFFSSGGQIVDLMNNPFLGMSLTEKYSTILFCLMWYVKLLFVPHPLTHDYYPYHVPKLGLEDARTWMAIVFISVILITAFLRRRKDPILWYTTLFFAITISVASNIVIPVGTFMNERFLFIPSIAFVILIVHYSNTLISKGITYSKITFTALGLIMILYGIRTFTRIPDWTSGDTLNFSAIKVSKNSARINLFTGVSYFHMAEAEAQPQQKKRFLDEATRFIDKALFIFPDYDQALNMKAGILAEYHKNGGSVDDFLTYLVKVVEKKPNLKFVNDYLHYISGKPENNEALYNFYFNTGYEVFFKKGKKYDYAIQYLEEAYKIRRNDKPLLEKMIEVYSIVSSLKGMPAKQVEDLKSRLSELKLIYQMTLH
ncbi:MAG: hypothetical protein K1X68_00065 [Saprospiraceae bacterium]|nr:hypothetical protein [Saprospiraceae bacterium]HMW38279.1 hypothetical protein [Saprospiraceae bacterium]HMX88536.1 hypothetical protein [Saprospiraceae bacterium]HMZ40567.1 hypothetical protein [Saprospiraceae bacterium]HNA63803.1 hypothetical protein [Saprospiraceae bacterium]